MRRGKANPNAWFIRIRHQDGNLEAVHSNNPSLLCGSRPGAGNPCCPEHALRLCCCAQRGKAERQRRPNLKVRSVGEAVMCHTLEVRTWGGAPNDGTLEVDTLGALVMCHILKVRTWGAPPKEALWRSAPWAPWSCVTLFEVRAWGSR